MSYANTALLLPLSGADAGTSFPDWSRHNRTVTAVGDAQTSTAQSKFYGSSALFDGTGDYLTTNLSGADSAVTDGWRLRVHLYVTNLSENRAVASTRSGVTPSNGWQVFVLSADNKAQFVVFEGSSSLASIKSAALSLNTWHHLEVGREGTTYYAALDGTVNETVTVAGTPAADAAMQISASPHNTTNRFAGHMQDFHVETDGANSSTVVVPGKLIAPVAGTITDDVGAAVERRIWVIPRGAESRMFTGLSDAGDGTYSIDAPDFECARIVLDDDAGTTYNDLIDRVAVAA